MQTTLIYEPYFEKPGHFREYVMRIGAGAERNAKQVSFLLGCGEDAPEPQVPGAKEVFTFRYASKMAQADLNKLRVYANFKGIWALVRLLASGKYACLHTIDCEMLILTLPLLLLRITRRLQPSFTFIYTQHAGYFGSKQSWKRRLYYYALRFCIKLLSATMRFRFATHGTFTTRQVVDFFHVPADDVLTLGYGADPPRRELSKAAARAQLGIPADKRVLLFFGLIRKDKGLMELIEVLGKEPQPNLYLVVAGLPSEYTAEQVEAAIDAAGIREQVKTILRYVNDSEISAVYAAADFLAMPYSGANWSNSGPLNIACQYGLPVLASNAGERGEIVGTHGLGIMYEPDSLPGLMEAVRKLAALSADEMQQYVDKATAYGNMHTWEKVIDRLLVAYV